MRRGVANYFEREQIAPDPTEGDIIDVPVRFVPMALSALETRKARSFWTTDEDWARGLNGLARMQWGMLMPFGEDLIREVRETRGPILAGTGSGLADYPVGDYPGYTVGDVVRRLGPAGTDLDSRLTQTNLLLAEVRDAILAGSTDNAALLEAVTQIGLLLAV